MGLRFMICFRSWFSIVSGSNLTISAAVRMLAIALALGCAIQGGAQTLTVTTIAGSRMASDNGDGVGAAAHFGSRIAGGTVNTDGNFYVIQPDIGVVRRVTPDGAVTTFAGALGHLGYVDATGSAAQFQQLSSITHDASGTLYVGDNGYIRKIAPSGEVTTLVAQPSMLGVAGGGPDVWRFSSGVTGMTFDGAGNLYVALRDTIRRILYSNGADSLIAGDEMNAGTKDGVGATARFSIISGLVFGSDTALYASDVNAVRRITMDGTVTTLAGVGDIRGYVDGDGANARFDYLSGIARMADGDLLVTDGNSRAVRRVTLAGHVSTVAGGGNGVLSRDASGNFIYPDGAGSLAAFQSLSAVAVDVTDKVYLPDGGVIRTAQSLGAPPEIARILEDQSGNAGQRVTFSVTADGNPVPTFQWQRLAVGTTAWANLNDDGVYTGTTTSTLVIPAVSTAMSGDWIRCVVSNAYGSAMSRVAQLQVDPPVIVVPLRVTTLAGQASTMNGGVDGVGSAARLSGPDGVAFDPVGNLYVSDGFGDRIRKITPEGLVTTIGGNGQNGSADGSGAAAQFFWPAGIVVDAGGTIYVADSGNSAIRKITPAGVVTTLAGTAGNRGTRDGTGAAASFNAPAGLALEPSGNLLVTDLVATGMLRRVTPDGVVTTVPLQGSIAGQWRSLAVDAKGNIYLANATAHTIQKIAAGTNMVMNLAGQGGQSGTGDGVGAHARFNAPRGIAVDADGNVYVTDTMNAAIRRISPTGTVTTVAGSPALASVMGATGSDDGIGDAAQFNQPAAIAVDASGTLAIADLLNNTIRRAWQVDVVATGDAVQLEAPLPTATATAMMTSAVSRMSVHAVTSGPVYQWSKDGTPIPGATDARLQINAATPANSGNYTISVQTGLVTSPTAPVAVTVNGSRLVNLSIRSGTGAGDKTLIVGFTVDRAGMPLLVRGVGPGLRTYGIDAPLADPGLSLYAAGARFVADNSNWQTALDEAAVAERVGAFALSPTAADAAIATSQPAGLYSAQCASVTSNNGVALVELYDANPSDVGRSRLINVSARSFVGTGDNIMAAGFAIRGQSPRTLLIRGIGPGLAGFGVGGTLADPIITVHDETTATIAQNDNWSDADDADAVAEAMASVGAFGLTPGAKDAALLVSLAPGMYSVHLSGRSNGTGVGLIEVYDVTR